MSSRLLPRLNNQRVPAETLFNKNKYVRTVYRQYNSFSFLKMKT